MSMSPSQRKIARGTGVSAFALVVSGVVGGCSVNGDVVPTVLKPAVDPVLGLVTAPVQVPLSLAESARATVANAQAFRYDAIQMIPKVQERLSKIKPDLDLSAVEAAFRKPASLNYASLEVIAAQFKDIEFDAVQIIAKQLGLDALGRKKDQVEKLMVQTGDTFEDAYNLVKREGRYASLQNALGTYFRGCPKEDFKIDGDKWSEKNQEYLQRFAEENQNADIPADWYEKPAVIAEIVREYASLPSNTKTWEQACATGDNGEQVVKIDETEFVVPLDRPAEVAPKLEVPTNKPTAPVTPTPEKPIVIVPNAPVEADQPETDEVFTPEDFQREAPTDEQLLTPTPAPVEDFKPAVTPTPAPVPAPATEPFLGPKPAERPKTFADVPLPGAPTTTAKAAATSTVPFGASASPANQNVLPDADVVPSEEMILIPGLSFPEGFEIPPEFYVPARLFETGNTLPLPAPAPKR